MEQYAEKILAHHGYDPKCDKSSAGMMNYVFLSKDKVVRIQGEHSAKVSSFAAEKWAMERARENGAPVFQKL